MKRFRLGLLTSLLVATMFLVSCAKQKSPEIISEEVKGTREIQRLEACTKVNFNKGVLLYQNVQQLFVCSKWDEQFPNMFQSLNKVSAASWDHLMAPIDQSFIENQQRRDRVFKNIRDLDSKGGLDDLSYVLVALNETNFFDSIKTLFSCVDNPSAIQCNNRLGRIPTERSLKNIIRIIDTNPENIETTSQLLKYFVEAIKGNEEPLRTEVNKFRLSPLYIPARIALIDAIADKAKKGLSSEDRTFISKILLTGDSKAEVPWLYSWVQSAQMTRTKFRDLIEFPALVNPAFVSEFSGIKKAYDDSFSCTFKDSNTPNELIDFDLKTQLFNYASIIKNSDQRTFFDYSSANLVGMKLSSEICKELEKNKYNVNLNQALVHFAQFMSEKNNFDLTKFLVNQTTVKGDADQSFAQNIYLADLVTGNIFSSSNLLSSNIISGTRDFFPIVFDILKNLRPEGYVNLGELSLAINNSDNDLRLKGVADLWSFFTPEEKNFLFNFIDRHFDNNTNYVLLLDFYTKFLDELKEVQPLFKDKWMGSSRLEEMSYLTLQDLFSNFAGKETLLDFKKFFSRDQILKVLEIISNGQQINKLAKEELEYIYSDNYIIKARSEKYKFKVTYNPGQDLVYDSKNVIECMDKFSDIQNGLYYLLRNLPASCARVSNSNIAFRLYGWLNSIEEKYINFKKSTNAQDSLLDKNGLLSPYLLNSTIGLTKVLDSLLGPINSIVPTRNGMDYLLSSANYQLNANSAATLINSNLIWLNTFFRNNQEKNQLHRNALVKTFSKEDNFLYTNTFFNNVGKLLQDYGAWISKGELARAQERSLGEYDSGNDCTKVLNQVVALYPCPSKAVVKQYGEDMLYYFQNIWEKNNGSPVGSFLKAFKTGEGLSIPLESKSAKKNRISLGDTFRYLYDTSDRNFPVNNISVKYVSEYGTSSIETLTTLERVESVIREVRFENNYLGAAFLNAVTHSEDYNKEVQARKKLLQTCLKIPVVRCAHKMSNSDLRMALNSLETFDSLSDVNNGRGLDSRLKYGEFLKTVEAALVGTSASLSQKVQLFPLRDELLKTHNGKVLTDMTVLSLWSNSARVIRDRVGRTRSDFESFVNSKDFKRVDRALLAGFDLPSSSISAESLIKKLLETPKNEGQNLFGHTVDWISSLNYSETRLVEDTLARVLILGSYLGPVTTVFGKDSYDQLDHKYATNNLFQLFLSFEKIIDNWPTLKNYFPGDVNLIDVIKPINTGLYFLTSKLGSESDPYKNTAYLALNDLFLVFQTVLFDEMPNPRIGTVTTETTKGLTFFLQLLSNPEQVTSTYKVTRDNYHFLDKLHAKNGEWFSTVGQNIIRMVKSPQVDLTALRDYLSFSSKNVICQKGLSLCQDNYHFDEVANLISFLNEKTDSGQSNFLALNQKVFVENFDQILQMIDDLLPSLKIKKINPPLLLN